MPPQRHPNTVLSFGHHTMGYSRKFVLFFSNFVELTTNINMFAADLSSDNSIYQASGDFRAPTKSSDSISIQSIDSINYSEHNRCASVKSRPSARRISAAELEHLMIRQGTSQFQPIPYEDAQVGPKKFTSIADMKRRKQQRNGVPSPSINRLPRTVSTDESPQHQPLKSFSSSPDLQSAFQPPHLRKQSTDSSSFSDYSKPGRNVLRPKTPPVSF
jgi:hypothetical protein